MSLTRILTKKSSRVLDMRIHSVPHLENPYDISHCFRLCLDKMSLWDMTQIVKHISVVALHMLLAKNEFYVLHTEFGHVLESA